ncbi:Bug family tripartite tricarboxylate transporter substrate binding protein [Roseomonas haemaphysalidis]|uniref:Tripartite tricarboxylate transporter substrate binding protein n=1 Tax=Roseomonas haemaphysalidis TaxID=2768162 RepID=A0ABS3KL93_9PROT|nr:tripartite tricarboxylate transporter substrate binding protein [Roseomonas haemaphysalidis]MBO1077720.1 tripartite tricarboxylate transporter substrate binding protein [Roseomonas haemaphysalidis]
MTTALTRRSTLGLLSAPLLARSALAQGTDWKPDRPVRIIVPFPAGGGLDLVGRVLAEAISPVLGQPVVVENRSGAAGALGIEQVFHAAPDGHTLGITSAGNITIGPLLRRTPYAPMAMTHVSRLTTSPLLLMTRKDLPATDLDAFIAWARAKPEEVRFGSGGIGSSTHLALELMNVRMNTQMLHVPYRGTTPLLTDLAAGNVDIGFSDAAGWPMVEQGTLRLLAVSTAEAWPRSPTTPTLDSRLGDFRVSNWYGLVAPPALPAPILAKLETVTAEALALPTVQSVYASSGFTASAMPQALFQPYLAREIALWNDVINAAKIEREN